MKRILAIESSCDETAVALVEGDTVVASEVASQFELHAAYGGVVPEIASRRHMETIDALTTSVLDTAGGPPDAVAATQGPGLIGALLVGYSYGRGLAAGLGVPFIPVDHLLGHVASLLLAPDPIAPPFLCLLASGGHTMLIDVTEDWTLTVLGRSRDDAAGEAFDKGSRLLGLGQPGGPAIAAAAAAARAGDDPMPDVDDINPAMVHHDGCDTSFAGIKTALAVHLRAPAPQPTGVLAAAYEDAIVDTLAAAVGKALRQSGRRRLGVVGGVAANRELRTKLTEICQQNDVQLHAAPLQWCSDNAAMIGMAARFCGEADPAGTGLQEAYAASPLSRLGVLAPTATP